MRPDLFQGILIREAVRLQHDRKPLGPLRCSLRRSVAL